MLNTEIGLLSIVSLLPHGRHTAADNGSDKAIIMWQSCIYGALEVAVKSLIKKEQRVTRAFTSWLLGVVAPSSLCPAFVIQYWWFSKDKELEGSDPHWPGRKRRVSGLSVSSSLVAVQSRSSSSQYDTPSKTNKSHCIWQFACIWLAAPACLAACQRLKPHHFGFCWVDCFFGGVELAGAF